MSERQPTVEDVARVAGVSRQTVSNVLNSPDIVRPDTRERVEAAIAELRYRPHASARRLRTRKSASIGVRLAPALDGISGALLDRFLHALTEEADERGMRILLYTAATPEEEIRQIRKLHDGADVDAFVLTASFAGDPRIKHLLDAEIPFVAFGRPWGADDLNQTSHLWVDVDGADGVRQATEQLIADGKQAIGFLGWPRSSGTGDDRRSGWEQSVLAQGASPAELDDRQGYSNDIVHEARSAAAELLQRNTGIDALVCVSDSLALGAVMAANELGRLDVAIIGFDNTPVAQALGIPSIEQRLDIVAAEALELLLGPSGNEVLRRELNPGEAHRLITPRLVIRRPIVLTAIPAAG